jgi:hypothetical protein
MSAAGPSRHFASSEGMSAAGGRAEVAPRTNIGANAKIGESRPGSCLAPVTCHQRMPRFRCERLPTASLAPTW